MGVRRGEASIDMQFSSHFITTPSFNDDGCNVLNFVLIIFNK